MKYVQLGRGENGGALEGLAREFYLGDHETERKTRENFRRTGLVASAQIIEDILPQTKVIRDFGGRTGLQGVLLIPIARTGLAVCGGPALDYWQNTLRGTRVWMASIGASRGKDSLSLPAEVYFQTLRHLPNKDWKDWIVVVFEYGLATASTIAGVYPVITTLLPGLDDANLIIFANCFCRKQSRARLDQISTSAIFTYGSSWLYDPVDLYLNTMLIQGGDWKRYQPRDWGKCAFGDGGEEFIRTFAGTVPESQFTEKDKEAIRAYFASR